MKRNEYRLQDAIAKVADYGLTDTVITRDAGNPIVRITQDWWPDGTECANFFKTRGKYRGVSVGFAIRAGRKWRVGQ